jgi:Putative Actinobacterial Holin-X, holin superfamily III
VTRALVTTRRVGESVGLLELATRLIADLRQLIDQRLQLLRAELTQEATRAAKSIGVLLAGVVGAGVGVAFLLLALGLWVGHLVGSAPGGLAIVGGGLVVAGVGLGLLATKSLERQRLAREMVRELRRDAEWIRNGV